jgi:hypothetical protein
MPVRALVYVSQKSDRLGEHDLEALVAGAATFNATADVTGILLFDGQRFLQYLEGPEAGLEAAFSRVCAAASHSEIMLLAGGIVGARFYPSWSMMLIGADRSSLGQIASGDWNGFVRRGGVARPTAMDNMLTLTEKPTHVR